MRRAVRNTRGAHRRRLRPVLGPGLVAVVLAGSAALVVADTTGEKNAPPGRTEPAVRLVNQVTDAQLRERSDVFGIRFLHPTRPEGTYWISGWGAERSFSGRDPDDPWFDAAHGSGSYLAADGRLAISGTAPRMYVHDPALERQWRDVEVTVYVKRVRDTGIPFAGLTVVARANHLRTEDGPSDLCDTRGYGGRLRFDGHADFEKETAHPHNQATGNVSVFGGGMPKGVWIGVKYLVFDRSDGVHLELWLDLSDGLDGGQWRRINEVVDDGHRFGDVPCAAGIDPAMALTGSPERVGSESGRPNVSVYFRSDGIGPQGLLYQWASIREITP